MPKVELHRHLEGSLQPEFLFHLAKRNGLSFPFKNPDEFRANLVYSSFADFVKPFLAGVGCIRTPQDTFDAVVDLGRQLAADNIVYAEVTFTPQFYRRLFPIGTLFDALNQARQVVRSDHDIEIRWIPDLVRNRFEISRACLGELLEHDLKALGVVALGLGGPEAGHPASQYAELFAAAAEHGLPANPHAGETDGPESIWSCLRDLNAVRIGHGVRAVEDEILVAYLIEHEVMLECCVGSNIALQIYTEANHPLRALKDAGVRICLNTDDPVLFNTTLTDEYLRAVVHHGFSIDDLKQSTRQAAEAIHGDLHAWVAGKLNP
jgi:adenosine deaminase